MSKDLLTPVRTSLKQRLAGLSSRLSRRDVAGAASDVEARARRVAMKVEYCIVGGDRLLFVLVMCLFDLGLVN